MKHCGEQAEQTFPEQADQDCGTKPAGKEKVITVRNCIIFKYQLMIKITLPIIR
jgi:hypothetical protein